MQPDKTENYNLIEKHLKEQTIEVFDDLDLQFDKSTNGYIIPVGLRMVPSLRAVVADLASIGFRCFYVEFYSYDLNYNKRLFYSDNQICEKFKYELNYLHDEYEKYKKAKAIKCNLHQIS